MGLFSNFCVLGACLAIALPATSYAQSNRSDQPISVNTGQIAYLPGRLELRDNVELVQGDARMRADRVVVELGSGGEFQRIIATGQVYYVTPKQTIRADRADYAVSTGQITATGDVILTEGQSVVTGGRIIYDVNTESARLDGGQPGEGRVRGVFYPADRSE